MPGLLAHVLFAMVTQALVGRTFGYPLISYGVFASGIITMLIDIDHIELPPYRTPVTHSVFFFIIWLYCGAVVLIFFVLFNLLDTTLYIELLISICSAFFSHILLDSFTKGGIFLFPKNWRVREWFMPLPRGKDIEKVGWGRYIIKTNWLRVGAIAHGVMPWKAWIRYPPRLRAKDLRDSRDPMMNMWISLVSIVILVFVVVI